MNEYDNILPEEINCPKCGEPLELEYEERITKKFNCPACETFVDLKNDSEKKSQSKIDDSPDNLNLSLINTIKNRRTSKDLLKEGVYYAKEDYADIHKRLVIDIIDFTFLILVYFIVLNIVESFYKNESKVILHSIKIWLCISYLYLTLLKLNPY
jgi:uncharacterized Zn finger protein (UPF0148 family)